MKFLKEDEKREVITEIEELLLQEITANIEVPMEKEPPKKKRF